MPDDQPPKPDDVARRASADLPAESPGDGLRPESVEPPGEETVHGTETDEDENPGQDEIASPTTAAGTVAPRPEIVTIPGLGGPSTGEPPALAAPAPPPVRTVPPPGHAPSPAPPVAAPPVGQAPRPAPPPLATVQAEAILETIGREAQIRVNEQSSPITVPAAEVFQSVGRSERLTLRTQPTYIEWAGTELAKYAGLIIAIYTGLITFYWIVGLWMFGVQNPPPVLPSPLPADPATLAQLTTDFGRISASHQAMWDAHQTRATGFFDTVIARTLLPVLTAILGYIFGAQRPTVVAQESSSDVSSSISRS